MPEFCNNRVNSTANYVMISNPIFLQVSPTVGGFKSQKIFPKPTALCPSLTMHDVHARTFVCLLFEFVRCPTFGFPKLSDRATQTH